MFCSEINGFWPVIKAIAKICFQLEWKIWSIDFWYMTRCATDDYYKDLIRHLLIAAKNLVARFCNLNYVPLLYE